MDRQSPRGGRGRGGRAHGPGGGPAQRRTSNASAATDDPLVDRQQPRRGGRGRGLTRSGAGQFARRSAGSGATNASAGSSEATEEAIYAEATLGGLRSHEATILATMKQHEDALARLRNKYTRVRSNLYGRFKSSQLEHDNAKLTRFQAGCPQLTKKPTKEEAEAQSRCLQAESQTVDDSVLGRLMESHLHTPPVKPPHCAAFRQVGLAELSQAERACVLAVGDARWGDSGLEDVPAAAGGDAGLGYVLAFTQYCPYQYCMVYEQALVCLSNQ